MGCNCGRNRTTFPPPAGMGAAKRAPQAPPAGLLDPATNKPVRVSRTVAGGSQTFSFDRGRSWLGR